MTLLEFIQNNRMKKNNTGSALIMITIFILVISIIASLFINNIISYQKKIGLIKTFSNREFLINQIVSEMKNTVSLKNSLDVTGNEKLKSCMLGQTYSGCSSNCCDSQQNVGFYFLDSTDLNTNVNLRRQLIGDSSANGVSFDSTGNVCQFSSGLCVYKLWGSFTPHCPGGELVCDQAEYLKVKVTLEPYPANTSSQIVMKQKEIEFIVFNDVNFKPKIDPVSDQVLYLGSGDDIEVTIVGNSGNPSEKQNFIFSKCESTDESIFKVVTPIDTPFSSAVAKIKIRPVAVGTAKIKLQVNDAGSQNNLSDEYYVNVKVQPGVAL